MSEHDRETEIEVLERNLWAVITGFSHREIAASIAKACDCDLAPASWALLEYLERSGSDPRVGPRLLSGASMSLQSRRGCRRLSATA